MISKILQVGAVLLVIFQLSAWAIDLSGNWIARIPASQIIGENILAVEIGSNKLRTLTPVEVVFNFRVNGEILTGKVTTPDGTAAIRSGKIDGNEISFFVERNIGDERISVRYKGKLAGMVYGDEIEFSREVEGKKLKRLEFVAKREFPVGDYGPPMQRPPMKIPLTGPPD